MPTLQDMYTVCDFVWSKMVLPAINELERSGVIPVAKGTIVVIPPKTNDLPDPGPIFIHDVDDIPMAANTKYAEVALSKAEISAQHGLPTSYIQKRAPYLYENGDTKWGGSAVGYGGLTVAFSGQTEVYDQMIAEWMLSGITAVYCTDMKAALGEEGSFLSIS